MFAALKPEFWWYVSRASGIVAWVLLALAVVWGVLVASKMIPLKSAPKWLLDTHRFLGALALCFTGVHLLALWADSYLQFGPRELFVPLASIYEPGAVAWGVVALYLLVAVELSSLAMRRLPRRLWRTIHQSSFFLFVFATVHGIFAGTDAGNLAVITALSMLTGVVIFAVVFRVLVARRAADRKPTRVPASTRAA
jgi:sulfoxide reductase heme-binding subunit YedZ